MKRFVILSCFLRGLSSTRFSPLGNHAAAFGLNKLLGNGGYHYLFGCKGKDFVWNEQALPVEYGKLIRCDEDLGRSTVAHFARKVRGANIVAAKHELIIQQSHAPERWSCSLRVRGPHFASKVSYNAGAAIDDYVGTAQISAARALPLSLVFSVF